MGLTRRQAEVLELRYVDGVPTDELVAELLGVQRPAVTKLRLRALARLRTVFESVDNSEISEQIAAEVQKWNQNGDNHIEGKISADPLGEA